MTFLSTMTIARMFMFDGSGHGYYLKWCFVFMLNWVIFLETKGLGTHKSAAPF